MIFFGDIQIDSRSIGLVVDPAFGKRLEQLSGMLPVWVAKTPANAPVAYSLQQFRHQHNMPPITVFTVDVQQSPDIWCADVLASVDLHHGTLSSSLPYNSILVFGAKLTDDLRKAFDQIDRWDFEDFSEMFRATKRQ